MNVLILYGSSRGRTRKVAQELQALLKEMEEFSFVDLHDIRQGLSLNWGVYQGIIMGSSTWDRGNLQRDFYRSERELEKLDLSEKWTAIFSCAGILYPCYAQSVEILENLAGRIGLKQIVDSLVIDDLDKDLQAKISPWIREIQDNLRSLFFL